MGSWSNGQEEASGVWPQAAMEGEPRALHELAPVERSLLHGARHARGARALAGGSAGPSRPRSSSDGHGAAMDAGSHGNGGPETGQAARRASDPSLTGTAVDGDGPATSDASEDPRPTFEDLAGFEVEQRLRQLMGTVGTTRLKAMERCKVFDPEANHARVMSQLRVVARREIKLDRLSKFVRDNHHALEARFGQDRGKEQDKHHVETVAERLGQRLAGLVALGEEVPSDLFDFVKQLDVAFDGRPPARASDDAGDEMDSKVWWDHRTAARRVPDLSLPPRRTSLAALKARAMEQGGAYTQATDAQYLEAALRNLKEADRIGSAEAAPAAEQQPEPQPLPKRGESVRSSLAGADSSVSGPGGAAGRPGLERTGTRALSKRSIFAESSAPSASVREGELLADPAAAGGPSANGLEAASGDGPAALECREHYMRAVGALPNVPLFHVDWFPPTPPPCTLDLYGAERLKAGSTGAGVLNFPSIFTDPDEFGRWATGDLPSGHGLESAAAGPEPLSTRVRRLLQDEYKHDLQQARSLDAGPAADTANIGFAAMDLGSPFDAGEEWPRATKSGLLYDIAAAGVDELDDEWCELAQRFAADVESHYGGLLQTRTAAVIEQVRASCPHGPLATEREWMAWHLAAARERDTPAGPLPPRGAERLRAVAVKCLDADGLACAELAARLAAAEPRQDGSTSGNAASSGGLGGQTDGLSDLSEALDDNDDSDSDIVGGIADGHASAGLASAGGRPAVSAASEAARWRAAAACLRGCG